MKTILITFTLAALCAAETFAAPLKPVNPPDFSTPEIGYYGCWTWPDGGWTLITGAPGDANSNPCSSAGGAAVKRTGMYSTTGMNIAEARCAPNFYWLYAGYGTDPLGWAFADVSTNQTGGFCSFNLTIGDALRTAIPAPLPPVPAPTTPCPRPSSGVPYTFNVNAFANNLQNAISAGTPTPVGYQLAVRDPQGTLVHSTAVGSVTGSSGLPATPMTTSRRIDVASMSKTITATALMAALEDLAQHQPQLGLTLDSSIVPFLPGNWNKSKVGHVTFRSLLRHTSGFVTNGGDYYANLKTMIEIGPDGSKVGKWNYYNGNYALIRILIPYLVDGPDAYKPFESNPTRNAQITGLSYRNYVRGKIFAPLGLSGVDLFHTGPLPETIYFDANKNAISNKLNLPGIPGSGYDMTANNHVLTAGSGNWTLSAEEYSLFISSLWLGKIISPSSVAAMLGQNDQSQVAVSSMVSVGMGMYGTSRQVGGATWWDYNHGGGGWLGGPVGTWMTFFNGYTAVFLSNTAWGLPNKGSAQLMEESFLPALTFKMRFLPPVFNKVSGEFTLTWESQPGAHYTIERSTDLKSWIKLKTGHPSAGLRTSYTDKPDPRRMTHPFYRIRYETL